MSYALIFSLLNPLFFPLVSFDILSRTPSLPVFSIPWVCSVTQLCTTLCNLMDCSRQVPLSMGFSTQEYWSGLPFFPPGDLLRPGVEPTSPASSALQVDSLLLMSSKETVWMCQRYLKPTYSESILIIRFITVCLRTSPVAQMVKCLSTMRETWVGSLGREDPLEKEMAIHSSTIAWKIPWTEELGGLQSMGSQRVGHDWATSLSFLFLDCV